MPGSQGAWVQEARDSEIFPVMIDFGERQKGEQAKAEAREHFHHAMSLLGRDGNTQHFIQLISKFHAALWRWKRIAGAGHHPADRSEDFF